MNIKIDSKLPHDAFTEEALGALYANLGSRVQVQLTLESTQRITVAPGSKKEPEVKCTVASIDHVSPVQAP